MEESFITQYSENSIKDTSHDFFSKIVSNFGDINIVLNPKCKILNINIPLDSTIKNVKNWTNKNLYDFLTIESKEKLDMQITALSDIDKSKTKWFELNHISEETGEFPVRYKGFKSANKKNIILIGNDLTPIAEIQKKFVNSQLALEKEYLKFRSFETKYKALIEFSEEPLVMLEGSLGSIIEINDSALKILNQKKEKLIGTQLSKYFKFNNNKEFLELIKSDKIIARNHTLTDEKSTNSIYFKASNFRAENEICIIVGLQTKDEFDLKSSEFQSILNSFYEKTRDGIIFTDKFGTIKHVNDSFMSLCKTENQRLIIERPFSDFLARGIVDLKVLIEAALENGSTMPFKTQLISNYDIRTDIEITGTNSSTNFGDYICFKITHNPSENENKNKTSDNVVSEKATKKIMNLVGSAPLKDLVADTSDIVEKICIETALKMTKNNRVATAEMLNLSRQSLYVKLRKYSLL